MCDPRPTHRTALGHMRSLMLMREGVSGDPPRTRTLNPDGERRGGAPRSMKTREWVVRVNLCAQPPWEGDRSEVESLRWLVTPQPRRARAGERHHALSNPETGS